MKYNENAKENLNILAKGAFITSQYAGQTNIMTIGWGAIGNIWAKPVFIAMVRKSRFTHDLLDKSNEFTITIPHEDMSEALALCGTKSGRSVDKIDALGLKMTESKEVNTPTIDCKGTHYECMVLYKTDMKPAALDEITKERWYADDDYHTIYFAEIVNTVEK